MPTTASAAQDRPPTPPPARPSRRLWWWGGWCLACALALTLRLPRLGERPMHADESVHAFKFVTLLEQGKYAYDPNEFHGPTLYYFTLPFAWLSGERTSAQVKEATLRLVPLAFGVGLILLLPLAGSGLRPGAMVAAGLLLAVSPAMVYYSRYYIHELLLVLFTWVTLAAGWRWWRGGGIGWAVLAGAGLGLMHATKETFVFNLVAAGAAMAATWATGRCGRGRSADDEAAGAPAGRRGWHAALGLGTAAVVSVLFFSSFFTHEGGWLQGPLDSVRTYLPWLSRAGGESPHIHGWTFYWERLAWWRHGDGPRFSELLILLLAVVGMVSGWLGRNPAGGERAFVRFLAGYTLALAAIYTVIPYKTPWCVLGFHHGFILLAGVGVATLWRALRPAAARVGLLAFLVAGGAHLAGQSCRAAFTYAARPENPWVYAHTLPDLLRVVERVLGVAARHGGPDSVVVKVMAPGGDYWPLPWYLRTLTKVGYFPAVPEDPFADIVVADSRIAPPLDDLSEKKWIMAGYYQQRPKVFVTMYVRFDLWKDYIESLPPPDDDEADEE